MNRGKSVAVSVSKLLLTLRGSHGGVRFGWSGHSRLSVRGWVLCDVMMPGMDGAETLRKIRHRVPALPVIMMSAMMTDDLRQHLCHIGAQTCLAKPMDRKELARALSPWCVPAVRES